MTINARLIILSLLFLISGASKDFERAGFREFQYFKDTLFKPKWYHLRYSFYFSIPGDTVNPEKFRQVQDGKYTHNQILKNLGHE